MGSGKTNVLLNLLKDQRPDIDKIYLYIKNPLESKYQLPITGRKKVGIKNDVYENLEDYNLTKKRRVLIVFNDMIADMKSNKKLSHIVTELFLRERKFNISLVFIPQSYFKGSKTVRLNATHYFIMEIPRKRELQQIASNHSLDIHFKDCIKFYKEYTKKPYSFLVSG